MEKEKISKTLNFINLEKIREFYFNLYGIEIGFEKYAEYIKINYSNEK